MSEPKRYICTKVLGMFEAHFSPNGDFVLWSDYAHLKAEVERLRASSFVTAVPSEDYEKLKAENERLRKAGDALYENKIGYYGEQILDDMKHHSGELCRNWNAAKDGKPTT